MAEYRFRLDALQKIRQQQRDQRLAQLADAYRADEILGEQQRQLSSELADMHQVRRAATTGRYLDINRLVAAVRYEPVLKAREQTLRDQKQLLDQEVERRRQASVIAERNVRLLERLDDRQREEHRQRQLRDEQKQLDEISSIQHLLQNQSNAVADNRQLPLTIK